MGICMTMMAVVGKPLASFRGLQLQTGCGFVDKMFFLDGADNRNNCVGQQAESCSKGMQKNLTWQKLTKC